MLKSTFIFIFPRLWEQERLHGLPERLHEEGGQVPGDPRQGWGGGHLQEEH